MKAKVDDEGRIVIELDGDDPSVVVKLYMKRVFDQMDEDSLAKCAEAICWDRIMEEACHRLTGESLSWAGDDDEHRLDFLCEVGDRLLGGYQWNVLRELRECAKNMTSHEHLYWKLFHDEQNGDWFRKWADANGIKCNHKEDGPAFTEFKDMVESMLNSIRPSVVRERMEGGQPGDCSDPLHQDDLRSE